MNICCGLLLVFPGAGLDQERGVEYRFSAGYNGSSLELEIDRGLMDDMTGDTGSSFSSGKYSDVGERALSHGSSRESSQHIQSSTVPKLSSAEETLVSVGCTVFSVA